jgi:hypothetical protein
LDVSNVDLYVYYKDKIKTICDIFIDDGLYVNINKHKLEDMFDYFNRIFKLVQEDMGCYVGLQIIRVHDVNLIFLHQHCYVMKIFKLFVLHDSKLVFIPTSSHVHLSHELHEKENCVDVIQIPCKEAIRCLLFILFLAHLNITYVLNSITRFCENPRQMRWIIIK